MLSSLTFWHSETPSPRATLLSGAQLSPVLLWAGYLPVSQPGELFPSRRIHSPFLFFFLAACLSLHIWTHPVLGMSRGVPPTSRGAPQEHLWAVPAAPKLVGPD